MVSTSTSSLDVRSGIASLTARAVSRIAFQATSPPTDIVEMPGIGDDQDRPPGGERNLLRTRLDQLQFRAVGILCSSPSTASRPEQICAGRFSRNRRTCLDLDQRE